MLPRAVTRRISNHHGHGRCWEVVSCKRGTENFIDGFQCTIRRSLSGGLDKTTTQAGPGVNIRETDTLIVGGGLMGSATAFWLAKNKELHTPRESKMVVSVVEKDLNYTRASSVLSVGGIRQQFSTAENIQLSLFTADFLKNIQQHLNVKDQDPPDAQFQPQGYLILGTKDQTEQMVKNNELQRSFGASVELLSNKQLKNKFPWLDVEGIEMGSYGLENEGWFDPWLLLCALKKKNISLGVKYIQGDVIGFNFKDSAHNVKLPCEAVIKENHNQGPYPIKFTHCVNAAGAWAGELARMVGIGDKNSPVQEMRTPLPVEPRKRFVYVFHCPKGPSLDCPLVVDTSGVYFRREGLGKNYLCGLSPKPQEEPDISNLDVDYEFFNHQIWPELANRVKVFEELKIRNAWAGFYDYNYVDQNLIIGPHPQVSNFYFANGSSGHGVQHAVAIGRAVTECISDGKYSTIDLKNLEFSRFENKSEEELRTSEKKEMNIY